LQSLFDTVDWVIAQQCFPFADVCKGVAHITCPEIPIDQVGGWQFTVGSQAIFDLVVELV
jgi:hypothetical protein